MKYKEPEMKIILLYDEVIITSPIGPLDPDENPGTGTGSGEGIVFPKIQ